MSLFETKKVRQLAESINGKEFEELTTNKQKLLPLYMFLYFIWVAIGLLTFQWVAFALILLLALIPKKWGWLIKVDSVLTLVILFFILLNFFHFQINLWELITQNLWFW